MPEAKRTRFEPDCRRGVGRAAFGISAFYASPSRLCAWSFHWSFSIRHSAFDRCHTMTLRKKLYLQNEPIWQPKLPNQSDSVRRLDSRPRWARLPRRGFEGRADFGQELIDLEGLKQNRRESFAAGAND